MMLESLNLKGFQNINTVNQFTILLECSGNIYTILECKEFLPKIKLIKINLSKNNENLLRFTYNKEQFQNIYGEESNHVIRSFKLSGIEKIFENENNITIIFEISLDMVGQFKITSVKSLNNSKELINFIKIIHSSFDRTDKFVNDLKIKEEKFCEDDKMIIDLNNEMNELEKKTYELKNTIKDKGLGADYIQKLNDLESFFQNNDNNCTFEFKKSKLNEYKLELKTIIDLIEINIDRTDKITQDKSISNNEVIKKMEEKQEFKEENNDIIYNEINYYKIAEIFVNQIDYYSNVIDQEYVRILEGQMTKFTENSINKASDILSKYQMISKTLNCQLENSFSLTFKKEELNKFLIEMKTELSFLINNK